MAYKIMLDAGHGGKDPGAVYKGRMEKNDCLRLTMAVGKILAVNGIDVLYTRTKDIYQTPVEKAKIANQSGAKLFISFHRNSSLVENKYNGVEVFLYNKKGLKYDMAENILGALGEIGFKELGIDARPGLAVLRRTRMPALLVEVGFINSDIDNKMFDDRFQEIAEAIAEAILGTLDEAEKSKDEYRPLYAVQVGIFQSRENADEMADDLEDDGYPAYMVKDGMFYKVQVGSYQRIEDAIAMECKLRNAGLRTLVVIR